ncbi:hypothetical protein NDU88_002026 [Pleurodeles waltl]|uniref:Uncharacterized protein n=1 Tax=Pleurodeles waltl TaxID=8319 RepID=A0AAV7M0B7_PLEWA|nr:hypothetical protein NDU88_002026 [Pleurodeles waltl]
MEYQGIPSPGAEESAGCVGPGGCSQYHPVHDGIGPGHEKKPLALFTPIAGEGHSEKRDDSCCALKGRDQKLGIEELTEEQDAPNRKDTPPGLENTNGRRQGEYDCGAEDTRIFEEVDRRSDLR